MSHLKIDLQDGFEHDHVVVTVDGDKIIDRPDVSTRTQIGLAQSIEREVAPGMIHVDVAVKSKNAHWSGNIDVTEPAFLGLSLTNDNRIVERVSKAPFGYL